MESKDVAFSSASEMWGTAQADFDAINRRWGPFTLDAAADETNHKCPAWLGYHEDGFVNGLEARWSGRVFVNPPFNRKKKMYVGPWVEKALAERNNCEIIVMLIPAKTGTRHWQDIIFRYAHKIRFIRGRLKFVMEGKDNSAPFDSALVVFVPETLQYNRPDIDTWPAGCYTVLE